MTTQQVAAAWGAKEARVRRWCSMDLLPAVRTSTGWEIAPHATPPFRDGPMIVVWLDGFDVNGVSASEASR